MLLPHLSDQKTSSFASHSAVVFFLLFFWTFTVKATEKDVSSWSFEKLENCLSKSKLFQAEIYQPKEYSFILEKSKNFLNLEPSSEDYLTLSRELEKQCVLLVLSLSDNHFKEELASFLKQVEVAESSFAEILARNNFTQGKQIYNESLLIQAELDLTKKSFKGNWDQKFESHLNDLESLHLKIQKGKEFLEKAITLSLAQVDQLIASLLEIERTLNYVSSVEKFPEDTQQISDYKTELSKSIEKIQSGQIKEGYLGAEKIRIAIGEMLSQALLPKFKRDSESLQEKITQLQKNLAEIEMHPENEEFHSNYIYSQDLLKAIQETSNQAQELNSMERYGEAFELLEEGFQLAALLEEDLFSLKRKQSHIRKLHAQVSKKESQKYVQNGLRVKKESSKFPLENKDIPTPSVSKSAKVHIIKPKDTLSRIAKQYYGKQSSWKKIYKANQNITNPNLIYPKQKIRIP